MRDKNLLKEISKLFEDHPIFTFIFGMFISFLVSLLFGSFLSDLHLRVTGVILHILFIIVTIWYLLGIRDRFLDWLNKESKYIMNVETGNYSITGYNISMHKKLSSDANLSDRVKHLESELERIESNFIEYSNEIKNKFNEIKQSIEHEEKSRQKSVEKLKDMIQSPKKRKKLNLEICGLSWLILGICLRTFSNEIVNYFI